MLHPLGEIVLVVPLGRDAAEAGMVAELESELSRRDLAHRRLTAAPVDAVRRELAAGSGFVVICGGQRSFAEAVSAACDTDLVLGVFPGGRPHDFANTFGLDVVPRPAALLLSSDRVMRVDVGRATVSRRDGETSEHLVVNDAVVGLGAEVCRRQDRLGRVPRVGPLGAWWSAVATYQARHFDVDMTFAEWHDKAVQVRIANGQFAHDGLHVSPLALPDDGAWDVQVWDGPKHLPFTLQPKMLHGEHLPHEHIAQWRQKRVEVTTAKPTAVAVDGRYVGTTPASFELRPGALRLKI
ncbi:MAG TPA: diacylglycerol kinase family protein [Mycobacteriales bacterium]|nr:diacylglycerol kinase family protein [Mycobacteriales bacterium]